MNDILDNIRNLRIQKGYSQDWMGEKLSLTQTGYSLIEAGKRGLPYRVLCQIAVIFDMDVIDLITYPEKWSQLGLVNTGVDDTKVILQIEMKKEKKDQVLKLAFGENILEILNK